MRKIANQFCYVSKIKIFRGKILVAENCHLCPAENPVCVKPSLFITGYSRALKFMKNSQWITPYMCNPL